MGVKSTLKIMIGGAILVLIGIGTFSLYKLINLGTTDLVGWAFNTTNLYLILTLTVILTILVIFLLAWLGGIKLKGFKLIKDIIKL